MIHFLEILWHTCTDTLKILPFLFLTYLLMELLEHRTGDAAENWLRRAGRVGPLFGATLGVLPQCGFSAAATGLYTARMITTGTLIAVYLSTSDEMLAIMISHAAPLPLILKILGTKLLIGMLAGFLIDRIARLLCRKSQSEPAPQIEELCEREGCNCNDHFALSALKHTLRITLFLLLFSFLLNLLIHGIGEDRLAALVLDRPVLGNLLAAAVGLIPNCASSVILTELYLSGIISVGCMLSGLLVNAGIATAILFRANRPMRDSWRILALLFCIGAAAGLLIDLTPLHAWF